MVVFDLDDTLYFERDFVCSAYNAIALWVSARSPMSAADVKKALTGAPDMRSAVDALVQLLDKNFGSDHFTPQMLVEVYRNHIPAISLRPGARELLDVLRRKGIAMGMITDGRTLTQTNKFEALGLGEYIPRTNLLISEEVGVDKHFERPFRTMMRLNQSEPRFTYIGDNALKDFHWPNVLGWETIRIVNPEGAGIHTQHIEVEPMWRARHDVAALPDALAYIAEFH